MPVAIHRRFARATSSSSTARRATTSPPLAADDDDGDGDPYDRRRRRACNGSAAHPYGLSLHRHHSVIVKKFRTSANSIELLTALSPGAYVTPMVLIWHL
jgi:hypothetical protein